VRDLTPGAAPAASQRNVYEDGPGRRLGGGVLAVEAVGADEVLLTSSRFACEGCVRRAWFALDGERAVTGVQMAAPGRLLVRYENARANPAKLGEVARDALEADPHNPTAVTLRYEASP